MTTAFYRLIQVTPDPFLGAEVPVGAVVQLGQNELTVVKRAALPSSVCLGSERLALAVESLMDRLAGVSSFDALPAMFGPLTVLSEPRPIPARVDDPAAWVSMLLSPGPATASSSRSRRPQRSTQGYAFFQTWRVARHVKKTFRPLEDGDGWLARSGGALDAVSHWVDGEDRLLLMEPIVPSRRASIKDVKTVAQRFAAYRVAFERATGEMSGRLVAYVTAGGGADQRAALMGGLEGYAHQVVDTTDPGARAEFLAEIKEYAASGDRQVGLA